MWLKVAEGLYGKHREGGDKGSQGDKPTTAGPKKLQSLERYPISSSWVCFSKAESLYVLDFQTFKQLPCVFARLHNRIFDSEGGGVWVKGLGA